MIYFMNFTNWNTSGDISKSSLHQIGLSSYFNRYHKRTADLTTVSEKQYECVERLYRELRSVRSERADQVFLQHIWKCGTNEGVTSQVARGLPGYSDSLPGCWAGPSLLHICTRTDNRLGPSRHGGGGRPNRSRRLVYISRASNGPHH